MKKNLFRFLIIFISLCVATAANIDLRFKRQGSHYQGNHRRNQQVLTDIPCLPPHHGVGLQPGQKLCETNFYFQNLQTTEIPCLPPHHARSLRPGQKFCETNFTGNHRGIHRRDYNSRVQQPTTEMPCFNQVSQSLPAPGQRLCPMSGYYGTHGPFGIQQN